jgi:GMP synthase-like glutamine amidotransferase
VPAFHRRGNRIQLIAGALGGKVYRSAVPETGWKPLELEPIASSEPVFSDVNPSPRRFQPAAAWNRLIAEWSELL